MTSYETLFVLKPTLTDEETTAQVEKIKAILTKEGAELLATNNMGMRKLAYPVEKNARGHYTILFYKANGEFITELERNLRINEDILKFLTVKYTKNKELAQFNKLVSAATKNIEETPKAETVEVVETVETAEVTPTVEKTEEA